MDQCSKNLCNRKAHKGGMCKKHWDSRNATYTYIGSKREEIVELKTRVCLMCDKSFESSGNRKCDYCNSLSYSYNDWIDSPYTSF